jgi:hypothetical protein
VDDQPSIQTRPIKFIEMFKRVLELKVSLVDNFGRVTNAEPGDGITDDTAAINSAISSGNRCGPGTCNGTTLTPAIVS